MPSTATRSHTRASPGRYANAASPHRRVAVGSFEQQAATAIPTHPLPMFKPRSAGAARGTRALPRAGGPTGTREHSAKSEMFGHPQPDLTTTPQNIKRRTTPRTSTQGVLVTWSTCATTPAKHEDGGGSVKPNMHPVDSPPPQCGWVEERTFAVASCFTLSCLYRRAISGTSGSSGFGSVSSEQTDSSTFEMVSAGDH